MRLTSQSNRYSGKKKEDSRRHVSCPPFTSLFGAAVFLSVILALMNLHFHIQRLSYVNNDEQHYNTLVNKNVYIQNRRSTNKNHNLIRLTTTKPPWTKHFKTYDEWMTHKKEGWKTLRDKATNIRSNGTDLWPHPVIVVGMPKVGTNTIRSFFDCGNITGTSHHNCGWGRKTRPCGYIIKGNLQKGLPLLTDTGNHSVYAQIDFVALKKEDCFFPQVEVLDVLYEQYPNATFLLNTRNTNNWVRSVSNFNGMHKRINRCNVTNWPQTGSIKKRLTSFFNAHNKRVKRFAQRHKSVSFVEVAIDAPGASVTMEKAFGINASCWGHGNKGRYRKES